LDITRTAQADLMSKPFKYPTSVSIPSYVPRMKAKAEQIEEAAKLINEAQKPYIFAGHGIILSDAKAELEAFVNKTDIPVATTLLGMSCIPYDHPNYVGWLGMHGNYGANVLTDHADLVIAIGMRFDDRVTGDLSKFIKQAKVVHIEIDPAEVDKNVKADAPVVGDAKSILADLLPLVNEAKHTEWRRTFDAYDKEEYDKITIKDVHHSGDQIRMGEAIAMLSDKTNGQAVTVTDVGQHQMVTNRYYQYKSWNGLVTSGGAGTMGFALPAAFGAKVGAPDREVVAIIGDGGFQMTIQELGTIAQSGLPVKIIILNNNFLGMVRQWQQLFFDNRYSFVELQNPDFIKITEGFGIEAHKVSDRAQLSAEMDKMLASKTPYLLEIVVEKEENVFPMVPAGLAVSAIRLE
jgi:acetolactate synthase I/II/III large subunit